MSKIVNIVCDEADGGWIYSQFIDQLKKHSKYTIVVNEKNQRKYHIIHFMPYYSQDARALNKPSSAWFSHQEVERKDLNKKFVSAAQSVDVAISHSNKYAVMLRQEYGLHNVIQIIPGIDLKKFKLRKLKRPENNKLVVGYVGRKYTSSKRKNPLLLDYIANMSFVDFRTTGGKLKLKDVPGFYRSLDVCISPALIEGGAMAVQESQACGVPIICFDGVGVAKEFGDSVLKARDEVEFLHILKDMYDSGDYIDKWRKSKAMRLMRGQIEKQTIERFVAEHDKVWDMITKKSWKKSK